MSDDTGQHVSCRYRRRDRISQSQVHRIDESAGSRNAVGSHRGEFWVLGEIGAFSANGSRQIVIWHRRVLILAAQLVTQRADLALKRINFAVPAKDHA